MLVDYLYPLHFKCLPLNEQDVYLAAQQYVKEQRVFFPKNNACTNVEKHTWTPINIPSLENIHFSKEARRRIMKSFYTGWDNRYGFYWDDGWFYVYRSFFLIGRFRLSQNTDGTYAMTQIQASDEDKDLKSALEETICPTLYDWLRFGDESNMQLLNHLCKYYHGEPRSPYESEVASKWWEAEKVMCDKFALQDNSFEKWCESVMPAIRPTMQNNPGVTMEEIAVNFFFETLHKVE